MHPWHFYVQDPKKKAGFFPKIPFFQAFSLDFGDKQNAFFHFPSTHIPLPQKPPNVSKHAPHAPYKVKHIPKFPL